MAAIDPEAGLAPELVGREQVVVLFDGPHDVEQWDVCSRHDELEVEYWRYGGEPEQDGSADEGGKPAPKAGERFVILSIQRGKKVMPMHAGLSLEVGDVAAVAVHREERESAEGILAAQGWAPERPA